jgi:hypothetical protein
MKVFTIYDKQTTYEIIIDGIVIQRIRQRDLHKDWLTIHFNDLPEHTQLVVLDKIEEHRHGEN